MRNTSLCLLLLASCCLQCGCSGKKENVVIEGTGSEVTPEMVVIEEQELETTE